MRTVQPELPGADLVAKGLADLRAGETATVQALLVTIGAPKLRFLGFDVPPGLPHPEHRLYERLEAEDVDVAHRRYNALVRRLVRFEHAACVG